VLRQRLFIDSRLVIIAFEMGSRRELDQISVAGLVFGEQDQMVINIAAAALVFFSSRLPGAT